MGLRIRLTPRAARDLEDIHQYLSQRSASGANAVRRKIAEAIDLVALYPGLGRTTQKAGVAMIPVSTYAYVIYFSIIGNDLYVVHVRHGARQTPKPEDL